MIRTFFKTLPAAVLLVLLQLFLMDYILIDHRFTPLLYVVILCLIPVDVRMANLLFVSFLYGLIFDVFHDTGGAHAVALTVAAYCRPTVLRLAYDESYRFHHIRIVTSERKSLFIFILGIYIIHHLIYYTLLLFSLELWKEILLGAAYNLLLSVFVAFSGLLLFYKRKK